MGWTSGMFDFDEKTKTSQMSAEINEELYKERGAMEPVFFDILLHKTVFNSYSEAEDYLTGIHDKGRDHNHAVRYFATKETKKTKELNQRKKELVEKLENYKKDHSVKTFKAEYVGCPTCGSKLKRELLKKESCPLCGKDLRSETTLSTIKRYNERLKEIEKQLKSSMESTKEKRWLVYGKAYLG